MQNLIDQDNIIANPEFAETRQTFSGYVDDLSTRMTELQASDLEMVKKAGNMLIDTLEINPELFVSPARAMMFTAISKRLAERGADDNDEVEFCHDATVLLALKHSGLYETMKSQIDAELIHEDEEHDLEVIDQYTDVELSERLRIVLSDKLSEVRKRLQVNDENEDPFEVRVLSVAGNTSNFYGLQPSVPRVLLEPNAPKGAYEKHLAKLTAYNEYANRLTDNNDRYLEQLGQSTAIEGAWVATINGVRYLCMPDPVARKILDPDSVIQHRGYSRIETPGDRSDESAELATQEHEYSHTQGGLSIDHNIFFGSSIEELRAEYFSGNRRGYLDAKQFLRFGLGPITGFILDDYMDANVKGGSLEHFYEDMAEKIGIDATLEVALAAPSAYLHESRPLHLRINEYLGGYDGILMRMYEKIEDKKTAKEAFARVAQRMVDMDEKHVQQWFEVLKKAKLNGLMAIYKEQVDLISTSNVDSIDTSS